MAFNETGVDKTGGQNGEKRDFRQISRYISETIDDRNIVTMEN